MATHKRFAVTTLTVSASFYPVVAEHSAVGAAFNQPMTIGDDGTGRNLTPLEKLLLNES